MWQHTKQVNNNNNNNYYYYYFNTYPEVVSESLSDDKPPPITPPPPPPGWHIGPNLRLPNMLSTPHGGSSDESLCLPVLPAGVLRYCTPIPESLELPVSGVVEERVPMLPPLLISVSSFISVRVLIIWLCSSSSESSNSLLSPLRNSLSLSSWSFLTRSSKYPPPPPPLPPGLVSDWSKML